MASIDIRDLTKTFFLKGGDPLQVLDNLCIEARDREFVCLLGPSGCGKSTSLHILAGLVQPDGGRVLIDGRPEYRNVTYGYVFQRPRLLNWKTVKENVIFGMRNYGVPKDHWQARVDKYVGLVGLESFVNEYPLTLSGGMQQRVAIARALAIEPDILLMDEPFSGLDELTARTMRIELLKIWSQERKTVLFVTHNALEAVFLADRIYLLTKRPASVFRTVEIDIPRPRDMEDERLIRTHKEIIQSLVG
ncbi:MAG: ABC transporter ATP-binding protein [Chloroflexi bacterium]|nr:ABC transporter ATP-binding protein [Chloroflexota bacterium]